MLQLHLSDQQFYRQLRCDFIYKFYGIYYIRWQPYSSIDASV